MTDEFICEVFRTVEVLAKDSTPAPTGDGPHHAGHGCLHEQHAAAFQE
ncbi:MAG: hypothetical protein IPI41_12455 [Flavobacteriales bacterium]|nr:hypothetical protein [Flavobacteriales bacterium]